MNAPQQAPKEQERTPHYITVKIAIWSKTEKEARDIAVQMMQGEEYIPPGSWYIQ